MAEVREYVKEKRRKYWKTIPPANMNKPSDLKFVAIDPNTYKVVTIFSGFKEIEFATNRKNLQPLILKHTNNQFGKNGSPLICGWILARFEPEELDDLDMEEFEKQVMERTVDKIVMVQLQRIKDNLNVFTKSDKLKVFEFLKNVESPNPNDINLTIKL